jgi:hypothetical protein
MIVPACDVPASMVMLGGKSEWTAATPILVEGVVRLAISIALVPTLGVLAVGVGVIVGRAARWAP